MTAAHHTPDEPPPPPPPPPTAADRPRRLAILGSTGSIGVQTIDVVRALNAAHAEAGEPPAFEVVALAAGRNAKTLGMQARELGVADLALADADAAAEADPPEGARLRTGADAAERLVREVECDVVMAAMVGFAGLPATLAAAERGINVALANKETLVAAGRLVVDTCARAGGALLPVDSEHSGVWQCLHAARAGFRRPPFVAGADVTRVTLTASGGALRDWPTDRIVNATPDDALAHPTWDMGAKVTIDCASLTNKALELIEAAWLFGLDASRLAAVIHPQSIVHAVVDFADGSSLAQLGDPDMRTPIQYALTAPQRPAGRVRALSLIDAGRLDFHEPDLDRFPALDLGFEVIRRGGTSGAVMNAANEVAVETFLAGGIRFGDITRLTRDALDTLGHSELRDLADVNAADREARAWTHAAITSQRPRPV